MKFHKTPKIIFAVIIFLCLTAIPLSYAVAQSSETAGVPFMGLSPTCLKCGSCSTCDILNAGINIGRFLIGIIGSLILVYFIYGGIFMLTSHGNPDMIQKGKKILINSVIGLIIVLLASVIVNFAVLVATGGGILSNGEKVTDISQFVSANLKCSDALTCPNTSAGSSTSTSGTNTCTNQSGYSCVPTVNATSANGYLCNGSGTCPTGSSCCSSVGGSF